jgi:hypothetical protein
MERVRKDRTRVSKIVEINVLILKFYHMNCKKPRDRIRRLVHGISGQCIRNWGKLMLRWNEPELWIRHVRRGFLSLIIYER